MGKSIKKVLVTVLIVIMIFGMTACGGSDNTGSGAGNTGKQEVKESKSEAPKIEEIDWNVDEGIVDGERTVALELTNNTKLTITGFEITFTERADLTGEEKEIFYSEIKKLFKPDDDEMETLKAEKIAMHAGTERVVLPGDTISKIDVYYYGGYYYMRNLEHYSLVTPDIATISYVDGDTIYKEYYDFKSKKYTMDDEKEKAQYVEKEKVYESPGHILYDNSEVETFIGWDILEEFADSGADEAWFVSGDTLYAVERV